MLRPTHGERTMLDSSPAERTNIVDFRRHGVWRQAALAGLAGVLFASGFFGTYFARRDTAAPTAPSESTWRGTALVAVPDTTPTVVDPIVPAAALPPLRVVTIQTTGTSGISTQRLIPASPTYDTAGTSSRQRTPTAPRSTTTARRTRTTTGPSNLITVTN
jgi:hypothetical protein